MKFTVMLAFRVLSALQFRNTLVIMSESPAGRKRAASNRDHPT
jgi:hypothetical protein